MNRQHTDTHAYAGFLAAAAEARSLHRALDAELMMVCHRLYPLVEKMLEVSTRVGAAHRALCAVEGRDPETYTLDMREALDVPEIPRLRAARMEELFYRLIHYPNPDPQPTDPRGT